MEASRIEVDEDEKAVGGDTLQGKSEMSKLLRERIYFFNEDLSINTG